MRKFHPHLEILPASQAALWAGLQALRDCGFVLYGGTAIALRLGHRQSVDFDFFTHLPLNRSALSAALPWLKVADILQDEPGTLTVLGPGGVKASFFGGLQVGRCDDPEVTADGVMVVASLLDLLAFKLKLTVQRVEAKDYLDTAAILQAGVPLARGLAAAEVLFEPALPPMIVLKALTYFEGGDLPAVPAEVRDLLAAAVADVGDLPRVERRSPGLF